ncbi:hypothetical protein D3C87_1233100 [compost metagenome]
MLVQRDGVAEPCQIRHIRQHIGRGRLLAQGGGDFLAEQILVADIRRHMDAAYWHRRLVQPAAPEVAERHLHHVHEPVEPERDELAERHQMVLVIAIKRGLFGPDGEHAVGEVDQ